MEAPELEAFKAMILALAADCQADLDAKEALQAEEAFPGASDPALSALWHSIGTSTIDPEQRAVLERRLKEHEIRLTLIAGEFPVRRVLDAARQTARRKGWRRFVARLSLLSKLSQKCDNGPVLALRENCVLFGPLS